MADTSKRVITVEVSKTIQVAQFEPVIVKVTETIETTADRAETARLNLYKDVTQSVKKFMDNEVRKYSQDRKQTRSGK